MNRSRATELSCLALVGFLFLLPSRSAAGAIVQEEGQRDPLVRVVDLNIGESQSVQLSDGTVKTIKLVDLDETRDTIRGAVRRATVRVEIDGKGVELVSATYHLPKAAAGVRIDCPVTRGYVQNASTNRWALEKDARLRLWPADSPTIEPGTFVYPATQRWFASDTQMANVPTFVDAGEVPGSERIYYHYGLDIGGVEGMVDIVAATDGLVVAAGEDHLEGYADAPVSPRYDVVYLLDARGWYYRYSHLLSIDAAVEPGVRVRMGQKIGVLGKEGGSGGWSHLHFDISSRQPSGEWGIQEGYAFLWEAYVRERQPAVIAVARPHDVARAGEEVILDGTRSWSADGKPLRFAWRFHDGSTASTPTVARTYEQPGEYSEVLRTVDSQGNVAYDFAVVQVFDPEEPRRLTTIHVAYSPTFDLRPGTTVTFKVRSFGSHTGETLDFGDGTPKVRVRSDGNAKHRAKDGYAVATHRFAEAGDYIVTVEHVDEGGHRATAHLHVPVRAER
jgi:murein DD-endopeptidase MepM/ murein hydrolase activator NlpD